MQSTGDLLNQHSLRRLEFRDKSAGINHENNNWLEEQDSAFDMSMKSHQSQYWSERPVQNDTINKENDQMEDLVEDSLGKK